MLAVDARCRRAAIARRAPPPAGRGRAPGPARRDAAAPRSAARAASPGAPRRRPARRSRPGRWPGTTGRGRSAPRCENRPTMFGPNAAPARIAGQHLHDQREAVALVAGRLLGATQRLERAGERRVRRRGRRPVRPDRPARQQRLAAPGRDLDPAARDRARRHVEAQRPEPAGRRRDGDGVRAEHRDPRPGRRDERRGVRQADADQPALRGPHRVPAGDAVVVAVAHDDEAPCRASGRARWRRPSRPGRRDGPSRCARRSDQGRPPALATGRAAGSMTPASASATYCGRRAVPWEAMPRRSDATRISATSAAMSAGVPTARRAPPSNPGGVGLGQRRRQSGRAGSA